MRIVCDTNVIVAGMLFGRHSRTILTAVAQGRVEAFTSPALLHELREVLQRSKFRLKPEQIDAVMELVRESFACVDSNTVLSVIADDPDDDRVLEAAHASRACVIVSGDSHLLTLGAWRSATVISPAAFVATYLEHRLDGGSPMNHPTRVQRRKAETPMADPASQPLKTPRRAII